MLETTDLSKLLRFISVGERWAETGQVILNNCKKAALSNKVSSS